MLLAFLFYLLPVGGGIVIFLCPFKFRLRPLPCNKNSDGLIKEICKLSNYQFVQHIPLTYLPLLTSSSSFALVALALKNLLPFVLVKLSSN